MNKILGATLIAIISLTSCVKDNEGVVDNSKKSYSEFSYSTVNENTKFSLNYANTGVVSQVYFEVYDENPVEYTEYSIVKKDGVKPLFADYTDESGAFSGTLSLPKYLTKVYIYSPAFFAQTLIEADVVNGIITATDDAIETSNEVVSSIGIKNVSATSKNYDSYLVGASSFKNNNYPEVWNTWLGSYDTKRNGEIAYKYTGTELVPENIADLYAAHTQVINVNKSCPVEYRSSKDMYINETSEIAITFLGQNTCWNSSLGYYYYKDGEKPSSLNDANVIMIFPNTQDGLWQNDKTAANKTLVLTEIQQSNLNIIQTSQLEARQVRLQNFRQVIV